MKVFSITLKNEKGKTLTGQVSFAFPDHYLVDIHDLKLNLKVIRDEQGMLVCEEFQGVQSNLIRDLISQIDAHLKETD